MKNSSSYTYLTINFHFTQGAKAQLEEVWEEDDGLDKADFDPKTFFKLHGKKIYSLIMGILPEKI